MNASQFTYKIRAYMKKVGVKRAEVRSKTVSFEDLARDSSVVATVTLEERLPKHILEGLAAIETHFRKKTGKSFIIQLAGTPYPMGGRTKPYANS